MRTTFAALLLFVPAMAHAQTNTTGTIAPNTTVTRRPSRPGLPCAQALSDLFVAGFGIIDVLPLSQQLQYTLVR